MPWKNLYKGRGRHLQKTNTIVYSCKTCLMFKNKHVKHLYVYPTKNANDYDPFYTCPIVEKANSIPMVHNSLSCMTCNENGTDCSTIGLAWFCYKSEKEHLKLFTPPISYVYIGDRIRKPNITSGVSWMCKKCFCTSIYYFNDSLRMNQVIACLYCNFIVSFVLPS